MSESRGQHWGRDFDVVGTDGGGHGGGAKPGDEPKEQPCYIPSGLLAKAARMRNGVEYLWVEPADAIASKQHWKLYAFKGKDAIDEPYDMFNKSHIMLGKEQAVCNIVLQHPSCSKQHAVIQFRSVTAPDGRSVIRPYLCDIGSTNGTTLNGDSLEKDKMVELRSRDVIKFASSSREYVIINVDGDGGDAVKTMAPAPVGDTQPKKKSRWDDDE